MEAQLENFTHVFYRSLIRRLSLRNSPSRVFKTETLWGSNNAPSRLRIRKKRGKILMLRFQSFIYFLSYTWSLKCGQLQDWKIQVVCVENSIDCEIGNFQTEGNVIMLNKHFDKSVLFKTFHLLLTNTKILTSTVKHTHCVVVWIDFRCLWRK